ncbi:S8 family serine peptidase [Streptomyces sp. NPDC086783]|uniref:S8 family serine peptidase n=1 Tax=Streptomyces sp. NPDC086783 TaxID=3365758 RepID=UPI003802AFEC
MVAAPSVYAAEASPTQWYLDALSAQKMWKVSTGKGVKVAVLDTGINPSTPALNGRVLTDEIPPNVRYGATSDYDGHGTSMAELIAGTGRGGGIQGLAPDAKVIPIRVALSQLKKRSKEEQERTPLPADAIRAAADTDAQIINMSFGSFVPDDEEKAAVKYAASKGKLLIAGAGNGGGSDNEDFLGYPAAYPEVVGVGAADESGAVGEFSQSGDFISLAAPGLDVPVWCDNTFQRYCKNRGTSQASAIASAAAALVWSAHPEWTANQVLRVLIDTAARDWPKNTPSKYLGYGLIRPSANLLKGKGDPGPADVNPITNEKTPAGASGATPSTSVPASSQPPKSTSSGETSAAGSSSEPSDGNTLWVVLGAVAAAAVIGGGGFAVLRARRNG